MMTATESENALVIIRLGSVYLFIFSVTATHMIVNATIKMHLLDYFSKFLLSLA